MGASAFESYASAPAPAERHGPVPDLDHATERYRVRFVRDAADLAEVCRLRFRVFNQEEGEGLATSWESGEDRDAFDAQCEHLMVLAREDGVERVVGTYRLQVGTAAEAGAGFYSANQFDFGTLSTEVLHDSVELGRVCIEREHRNRNVLYLLWRGLAAYVLWHGKRYFFGCNSLPTTDARAGFRMEQWLRANGHVHPTLRVEPLESYRCPVVADPSEPDEAPEIPALFAIYLRYGAKVCSPPALDREFGTIDFFTVNDLAKLDAPTFRRFADER